MENAQAEMAAALVAPMGSRRFGRGDFSWRREGQRIGHFLSWLGGGDPAGLRAEARLFATLLPEGLHAASAEAIGRAATAAVLSHGAASAVVVRFFFLSLAAESPAKALVVLDSLVSVVPAPDVPALVRVAIMYRPGMALALARAAMARVPAEATRIRAAAESVVVGLAGNETAFSSAESGCLASAGGGADASAAQVSDPEIRRLLEGSRGLTFLGAEDFGIAAVETQACGKPVAAFGMGAMEPIAEEGTGMFFSGAAPNL